MAFRINCKAFLLTYQNTSGKLSYENVKSFVFGLEGVNAVSVCEEIASRQHFHAYIQYHEKVDHDKSYYAIEGEAPADVQTNNAKRNWAQQATEGHFYVYCKYKTSHVRSDTTCKSRPGCRCILHLCQGGKMEVDDALKCAAEYELISGVAQLERDLETLKRQRKRKRMEEYNAACLEQAASAVDRPFRAYPMVAEFLDQFKYAQTRYKFLIIVGETRLGKTEYAKRLFNAPVVFSQATKWKEYCPLDNDAIIFDDVTQFEDGSRNVFRYVMNNKTLFQCGAVPITLGKSATGMYEYNVNVYRKPIVILCNHDAQREFEWDEDSWIAKNSFHMTVRERMFL